MIHAVIILEQVARFRRVGVAMLRSHSRVRRFSWPRQEACYFLRKDTDLSLTAIGSMLGSRDHTTVMFSVRQVEERITHVDGYAQQIENLTRMIETATEIGDDVHTGAMVDLARRVIMNPAGSSPSDVICLASTVLNTFAALTSAQLSDREARISARLTLGGTGGIRHAVT